MNFITLKSISDIRIDMKHIIWSIQHGIVDKQRNSRQVFLEIIRLHHVDNMIWSITYTGCIQCAIPKLHQKVLHIENIALKIER